MENKVEGILTLDGLCSVIENNNKKKSSEEKELILNIEGVGKLKFKKPTETDIFEMIEEKNDDSLQDASFFYNLILEPKLSDTEFLKKHGCEKEPYEIVGKIFNKMQVTSILKEVFKASGFEKPKIEVIEIKKS